ncbi:sulfurtransferase TusA family protein [Alicyclobacillus acidocaldarius]|uniref:SirA family protein n=1 Tax=Alicyclobacillus acidocaldarius subsp. acidocaldarius (strain ATCC 27009 / DSM 446 / BCRC 14685 / JCM 5260 / KCTC 1825 / NBRC 15652 / NCIMB 11725 / NRRL B-14509 / 104-IA) TaxID=521098 RepID=C8WTQ4_ALIAD|nr:sulfurtransferase TusA family protein [Alicyclobacillus acidocaldarius]ACV59646.1 SirA family protein [Alicyclobacillus acidocaldarius subsp. acidocaldarius DSM 446]
MSSTGQTQAYTVDKLIDCKGLSCPMPMVRTKKAIDEMEAGQVLEVLATDPGSVADIRSWATRTGHQYLGTVEKDGVFRHYIRKAAPDEAKPEKKYPHVASNEELAERVSKGDAVVIDVREPMEYAFGHIPGAILVPLGSLEARIDELKSYEGKDIYVVCRTGNRSDMACQILADHGFTRVKNVVPGMAEWNGPVEQSEVEE